MSKWKGPLPEFLKYKIRESANDFGMNVNDYIVRILEIASSNPAASPGQVDASHQKDVSSNG